MFNIIYQTKKGPQTDFEFLFNEKVLFDSCEHDNIFDERNLDAVLDNSVIVYSINNLNLSKDLEEYLGKFKRLDYVLFHCSNEGLNHRCGYYKNAKSVLRSGGWNPNITLEKVFSVPLAFQSEFYNENPNEVILTDRKFAWSFFGALKGDREKMYNALKSVNPFYHFQSKGWMDPENKMPKDVIEYYKESIFIPSPAGNTYFECNRTLDAMEWGCIPVTTHFLGEDCYKYVYGDHPFIVGKDWSDAASKMKAILSDKEALKLKQKEVWNWYQQFKKELSADVANILNGEFEKVQGKQFRYQRASRHNWKLRWRFFIHFTLSVYWKRIIGKTIPSN